MVTWRRSNPRLSYKTGCKTIRRKMNQSTTSLSLGTNEAGFRCRTTRQLMQDTCRRRRCGGWSESLCEWSSHWGHMISRRSPSSCPMQLQILWAHIPTSGTWILCIVSCGQFQWHVRRRSLSGHWNGEACGWVDGAGVAIDIVSFLKWSWPVIEKMSQNMPIWSPFTVHIISALVFKHALFFILKGPRRTTEEEPETPIRVLQEKETNKKGY